MTPTPTEPGEQLVRPGLRRLLDSVQDVPAYVVGRRVDVLAWNPLAAALITDFDVLPPSERNLARLVFLDESIRELYCDWPGKADDVVSYLRLDAGRHPDDPRLTALVGELELSYETFRLPDDPDQALITLTVAEDSPSHDALRLLTRLAADG